MTVELIAALGALFPRGGPVQDQVATIRTFSGARPTVGSALGFGVLTRLYSLSQSGSVVL